MGVGWLYSHPDLTVIRGEPEVDAMTSGPDCGDTVTNPLLVLIVLSPPSESYDRTSKFDYLRGLASLQEYVLISPDQPRVESFARRPDGTWLLRMAAGLDQTIRSDSLAIDLPLAEVFAGVTFPPPGPDDPD